MQEKLSSSGITSHSVIYCGHTTSSSCQIEIQFKDQLDGHFSSASVPLTTITGTGSGTM
jgi:hypothetical protein